MHLFLKVMKIHKHYLILKIILYFKLMNKTKIYLQIFIIVFKVIHYILIFKVNQFLILNRMSRIKIFKVCRKFKRIFKIQKIYLKKNYKMIYKKHHKNIKIYKKDIIVNKVIKVKMKVHLDKVFIILI